LRAPLDGPEIALFPQKSKLNTRHAKGQL